MLVMGGYWGARSLARGHWRPIYQQVAMVPYALGGGGAIGKTRMLLMWIWDGIDIP